MGTIKSISFDQHEILQNIKDLHCPAGFEADISYGNGAFYTGSQRPRHCFDIDPQQDHVVRASSVSVPVPDKSFESVVFDPPFLTYIKDGRHHRGGSCIMASRFAGYWRYDELIEHYTQTLKEVRRILKPKGLLVFKCQDIVHNHRIHCTHASVIEWAKDHGLFLEDLFILAAKHRLPTRAAKHGVQKQRHARIFHSYFLVFRRCA